MRPSPLARSATLLIASQFVAHLPCVDAADLQACGARLQERQDAAWNATNHTESPPQFSLPYEQCLVECGSGMEDVNWESFSQNFGAWLLPWIALMFQIPFGAEQPLDDVLSFLITIGSPALAAYSLQITHLNARWVTAAFLDVKYPNSNRIPTVISAFHHVPIRISHHPRLLRSLIVVRDNDRFWDHLLTAAKKTRRWSIPLIINFILVIFAVVLTVLDSVHSSTPRDIGYAITAIWTFLLPLIIGWLHVGCEPEPNHLRKSLDDANMNAWVATTQRDKPVMDPPAIEFMKADDVGLVRKDELKTVPVFNYSRAFSSPLAAELILGFMKDTAANAERRIPVGNPVGGGVPAWVGGEGDAVADENRFGRDIEVDEYCMRALPRLESGSSPTTPLDIQSPELFSSPNPLLPLHDPRLISDRNRIGTVAEVTEHRTRVLPEPEPSSSSTVPLNIQPSEMTNTPGPLLPLYRYPTAQNPSRWATGIWERVALATALALGLQWGISGAAVVIHYVTPPAGLGCRALSFLLYGVAGSVSFLLFLASSILAHMSRPHEGWKHTRPWLRTCQNAGAIICRWLGKCIAILSAIGILVVCFFQVTDAFNGCFCASTTFDKGRGLVVFRTINYVVGPSVHRIWVGGLIMAFSAALLFGFSMYLGTPPHR